MAETKIEWTATVLADGTKLPGYTFNPWWGCTPWSTGCQNCYASALSKRFHGEGYKKGVPRKRTSAANWKLPLRWNREAEKSGLRRKVFCASLADVFDAEAPAEWRHELFALIAATPNLDWLLLTKRPENILSQIERVRNACLNSSINSMMEVIGTIGGWCQRWVSGKPPANVWIGTSVENQASADERIPHLLKVPARVRFLSCEPLLGPVDLLNVGELRHDVLHGWKPAHGDFPEGCNTDYISWVICGGESGPGARPHNLAWAYDLKAQCVAAGVPFFMKQTGSVPIVDYYCENDALRECALAGRHTVLNPDGSEWSEQDGQPREGALIRVNLHDRKGGDMDEWPEDLRVRQMPEVAQCP